MYKFLIVLFLLSEVALGTDKLISSPTGNLILDAGTGSAIKANKELRVDTIKDSTGNAALTLTAGAGVAVQVNKELWVATIRDSTGVTSPPGMVPVGGLVAVMPNIQLTDAWQPPATGVIKDGFMRANGHIITAQNVIDGSKLRAGTVLPNMETKYLRGNSTSGTTNGSNSVSASFSGTPATYSVSVPVHSHGFSLSAAGQTLGSTVLSSTINRSSIKLNYYSGAAPGGSGQGAWGSTSADQPYSISVDMGHTHAASAVYGSIGSGQDGTSPFTASGSNTPAGSVTVSPTTGTAGNNEPAYVETVWVIRVK